MKLLFVDLLPGSTPGSRARNAYSFFILGLGVLLFSELWLSWFTTIGLSPQPKFIGTLALFGFAFFYTTTIAVIRLRSNMFFVAPGRLLRDIAISVFFSVVSFALFYRTAGIIPTFDAKPPQEMTDFLYFSIVTFSTLGYGDFRPSPDARLMAAAQALLGTVHIGMIVAAAFLTFSQTPPEN